MQYGIILNRDLNQLHADLWNAYHWRRGLYARLLSLVIVECFEDCGELLGKEIRNLPETPDGEAIRQQLKAVSGSLAELRRSYEELLRSVRNHAIGHRDLDAREQLDWINTLNPHEVFDLTTEVIQWTTSLSECLGLIMRGRCLKCREALQSELTALCQELHRLKAPGGSVATIGLHRDSSNPK